LSLTFKENTSLNCFTLYTHYSNTYQQGSKLLQTFNLKNMEFVWKHFAEMEITKKLDSFTVIMYVPDKQLYGIVHLYEQSVI